MKPWGVLTVVMLLMVVAVAWIPAREAPRAVVPLAPLEAAPAAFAVDDQAAALVRKFQFQSAITLLRDAERRFPPPYNARAGQLADVIGERLLPIPHEDDRRRRMNFHIHLALVAARLGDHRTAADNYWIVADDDRPSFAVNRFLMRRIRGTLLKCRCPADELRRLVTLAEIVPREDRQMYSKYLLPYDLKDLVKLNGDQVGQVRELVESYYDDKLHRLRCLIPAWNTSLPDDLKEQVRARIEQDLISIGDVAGAAAWRTPQAAIDGPVEGAADDSIRKRAEKAYAAGDYEASLALYRQVAAQGESHPDFGVAQFNIGACLQQLQQYDEAVVAFQRLIGSGVSDHDPTGGIMSPHRNYRFSAAYRMTTCYEGSGDLDAAVDWLVRGHFEYRVDSGCATCDLSIHRDFRKRWVRLLLKKQPSAAELELVWGHALEPTSHDRDILPALIDHYRRRDELGLLRREISIRLQEVAVARPPEPVVVKWPRPEPQYTMTEIYARPELMAANIRPYRLTSAHQKGYHESLRMLAELTQLVEWRRDGNYSQSWQYVLDRGLPQAYSYSRGSLESWKAELALALFVEDPKAAAAWLRRRTGMSEVERRLYWAVGGYLGTPEVVEELTRLIVEKELRDEYYETLLKPPRTTRYTGLVEAIGLLNMENKHRLRAHLEWAYQTEPHDSELYNVLRNSRPTYVFSSVGTD